MAGALTASTPVYCDDLAAVKTAVDLLTLAAATDFIFVLPVVYRVETPTSLYSTKFVVFKVERAA